MTLHKLPLLGSCQDIYKCCNQEFAEEVERHNSVKIHYYSQESYSQHKLYMETWQEWDEWALYPKDDSDCKMDRDGWLTAQGYWVCLSLETKPKHSLPLPPPHTLGATSSLTDLPQQWLSQNKFQFSIICIWKAHLSFYKFIPVIVRKGPAWIRQKSFKSSSLLRKRKKQQQQKFTFSADSGTISFTHTLN